MIRPVDSDEKALTMIELMIAVAVFATAILGVLAAISHGTRLIGVSREETVARQVAERRIAELRALGYGALYSRMGAQPPEGTTFTPSLNRQDAGLLPSVQGVETISADGRLLAVSVSVQWSSPVLKTTHSITLETKVAP
jgi:type II secretory pathway pseudopilin PulG